MDKETGMKLVENAFKTGFIHHNKIEFVEADNNRSVLRAKIGKNSLNAYGLVHGGLLFGLADNGMGIVAAAEGRNAVTVTSSITYIKPANGTYVTAVSEVVKRGKSIVHLESKLYNDKDELVATAIGSYYFIN